jgi:NAD(P)H-dependent FMN reductase
MRPSMQFGDHSRYLNLTQSPESAFLFAGPSVAYLLSVTNGYHTMKENDLAPRLNVIIASTRPGRIGPVFAKWFEDFARRHGKFEPVLVDLADFNLPVYDEPKHPRLGHYEHEHTKAWSASVKSADAFVFVTPEYNYFVAPSLVNALNFVLAEWHYKPAGFLSYGGVSGGLRAVQSAKPLLTSLKVMPIPEGVPIFSYHQFLDENGAFQATEITEKGATTMLEELHRWSTALKALRPTEEREPLVAA